jgi:zinc ribbon protein
LADVSLMAVPPQQDGTRCANCGAEVVPDQRYCLSCGHPVAPARLGFLDVLQEDHPGGAARWVEPGTLGTSPVAYAPPVPESGLGGWVRRNSAIFGLLSVLLMCLIVGLLVGHWVSQDNKAPASSTVKVEGLGAIAAPAASTKSTAPAKATPLAKAAKAKTEAKEAAEGAKETKAERAPPPAPKKVTRNELQKLSNSTGKKHAEEINAHGAEPLETGG